MGSVSQRSILLSVLICAVLALLGAIGWVLRTGVGGSGPESTALRATSPSVAHVDEQTSTGETRAPSLTAVDVTEHSPTAEPAPAIPIGPRLIGVVRDDLGRPWNHFVLLLRPVRTVTRPSDARLPIEREFRSDDGSYTLAGLQPGGWSVSAESGCSSGNHEIQLGDDDLVLDLVVPRPARLAGRVEDPFGRPSAKSRISVLRGRDARGVARPEPPAALEADEEGRFELRDLAPGEIALEAEAPGFARSARLELALSAGQDLGDLRVVLRHAARIVGRALDDRGLPDAGREIQLSSAFAFEPSKDSTTPPWIGTIPASGKLADEDGRFEFGDLAPGEYGLQRVVRLEEETGGGSSPERGRSLARLRTGMRVEVAEGETVQVVLGGIAEPGVRLWGFVIGAELSGEPMFVNAYPEDPTSTLRRQFSRVDQQGAYEILLDTAGEYMLHVETRSGTLLAERVSIPEALSQRLDLELGTSSIGGRVLDARGSPVPGAEVGLESTPSTKSPSRYEETDEQGSFVFDSLVPGTYALVARAPRNRANDPGDPGDAAAARVAGVQIEPGTRMDGVELRLSPGGAIEIVVEGRDGPVAGVTVRAIDPLGRAPDASPAHQTDALGRTRVEGLAPGSWIVRASDERLVCEWSQPIEVAAGATAHQRLLLVPGVILRVNVIGARAPGTWLFVEDARGFELARAWARELDSPATGGREAVAVGPLPFGRFTLRAEDPQGRSKSVEVLIDASRAPAFELDLRD